MAEIEFLAVSKSYDAKRAVLADLSFKPPAGRLCTILGPSGCGKSTLLRIAAGLEDATQGVVLLDGRPVRSLTREERSIAFLSQGELLFPHLSILENVAYGLRCCGLDVAEANVRGRAMLEMLGLVGQESRISSQLSGGQVQRVALARALVLEPSVVLLDEPLSSIDAPLKRRLMDEIRGLQCALGLTMLYVTHDQSEAMAIGDHIALMHDGRILQEGTPREVYLDPKSEYVGSCLGEAMVLTGRVVAAGCVEVGPLVVEGLAGTGDLPTTVRLLVRPQAWRVEAVGRRRGLPGRVRRCAYLGRVAEYVVDTDLGAMLVTVPCPEILHQVDAPVDLLLRAHGVKVLG